MGAKTLGYSREEGSSRSGIGKSVGFSLEKTHVSSVTQFRPNVASDVPSLCHHEGVGPVPCMSREKF